LSQRSDPGAPSDLADDSPNRNPEFVKPHPYKEGINITTKAGKHCRSCGWQFDLTLSKCPDCGSTSVSLFKADKRIDIGPKNAVAHLKRKTITCWNQTENSITGEIQKHPFIEERIPVISIIPIMVGGAGDGHPVTSYEWHLEVRCKSCGMAYQRIEGRIATPEEIEQFKAKKIQLASRWLGPNWSNSE